MTGVEAVHAISLVVVPVSMMLFMMDPQPDGEQGFKLLVMMDNEYAALGFSYDSFDDLMYDFMEETDGKALVVPGFEGVVVYQDPTDLLAWQRLKMRKAGAPLLVS